MIKDKKWFETETIAMPILIPCDLFIALVNITENLQSNASSYFEMYQVKHYKT